MVDKGTNDDAVFKALADPNRRAMIQRLSRHDLTIGELAEPLDMSLAGASKHVGILENAGVIVRTKRGRERICSLRPASLHTLRDWVSTYARFWDERLDALDAAIKQETNDE